MAGDMKMGDLSQIIIEAGDKKCIFVPYGDLFFCLLTRADTNLGLVRLAIRNLDNRFTDVRVVDLASGATRVLYQNPGPDSDPSWSPDGRWIAFRTRGPRSVSVSQAKLAVSPAAGGTPRLLTGDFLPEAGPAVWSPDGTSLFFWAQTRTRAELYSVATTGGPIRKVSDVRGSLGVFGPGTPMLSKDGTMIAYGRSTLEVPEEVYAARVESPWRQVRLTALHPVQPILDGDAYPTHKKIGITNSTTARAAQLATKMPFTMYVEAAWEFQDGRARELEQALHRLLGASRIDGEWFEDPEETLVDGLSRLMALFDTRPVTEAKLDTADASRKDLERRYAQTEERVRLLFADLEPRSLGWEPQPARAVDQRFIKNGATIYVQPTSSGASASIKTSASASLIRVPSSARSSGARTSSRARRRYSGANEPSTILFILGVASIVAPIVIAEQLIRKGAPIMLGVSLLTLALALDGKLGWLDGVLLLVGLIVYTVFALKQSRVVSREVQNEYEQEFAKKQPHTEKQSIVNAGFILIGLGLLVLGSDWLVESAVEIATFLGVSELVIGLTIVAVGTSLPEVARSVIAALKKESDIAVGNAVGSNIFNLRGVLGISALIAPGGVVIAGRGSSATWCHCRKDPAAHT